MIVNVPANFSIASVERHRIERRRLVGRQPVGQPGDRPGRQRRRSAGAAAVGALHRDCDGAQHGESGLDIAGLPRPGLQRERSAPRSAADRPRHRTGRHADPRPNPGADACPDARPDARPDAPPTPRQRRRRLPRRSCRCRHERQRCPALPAAPFAPASVPAPSIQWRAPDAAGSDRLAGVTVRPRRRGRPTRRPRRRLQPLQRRRAPPARDRAEVPRHRHPAARRHPGRRGSRRRPPVDPLRRAAARPGRCLGRPLLGRRDLGRAGRDDRRPRPAGADLGRPPGCRRDRLDAGGAPPPGPG